MFQYILYDGTTALQSIAGSMLFVTAILTVVGWYTGKLSCRLYIIDPFLQTLFILAFTPVAGFFGALAAAVASEDNLEEVSKKRILWKSLIGSILAFGSGLFALNSLGATQALAVWGWALGTGVISMVLLYLLPPMVKALMYIAASRVTGISVEDIRKQTKADERKAAKEETDDDAG